MAAKTHNVELPFAKETKNMLQYQTAGEKRDCPIPTLYVSKSLFPDGFPNFLKISVQGTDK